MKKIIKELKKYPSKILILAGIVLMIAGIGMAPDNIIYPIHIINYAFVAWSGIIIGGIGFVSYVRKIFSS